MLEITSHTGMNPGERIGEFDSAGFLFFYSRMTFINSPNKQVLNNKVSITYNQYGPQITMKLDLDNLNVIEADIS